MSTSSAQQMQQQWLALSSSEDVTDRLAAIRALSSQLFSELTPESIEALIERLGDEDEQITLEALQILQAHASKKSGDEGSSPVHTEWLVRCAKEHPLPRIRLEAIRGLSGDPDSLALECLCDIACNRPDIELDDEWDDWWDMQLAAVKALGASGTETAANTLAKLWRSEEGHSIESEIFAALAQLHPQGTDLLAGIALKENPIARRRALSSLVNSGDELAVVVLKKALDDNDQLVQIAALQGLQQLEVNAALPQILLLIEHKSAQVSAQALKTAAALSPGQKLDLDTQRLLHLLARPNAACASAIQLLAAANSPLNQDVQQRILSLLAQNPLELSEALGQFLQAQQQADADTRQLWLDALQQQLQHVKAEPFALRPMILAWTELANNSEQNVQSVNALLQGGGPANRQMVIEALTRLAQQPAVFEADTEQDDELNPALNLLQACLEGQEIIAEALPSETETVDVTHSQPNSSEPQISTEPQASEEVAGDIPVQMLETPEAEPKPKEIPTVEQLMADMPAYTESLDETAGADSTLGSINMTAQENILREHEPELSQDDRLRQMLNQLPQDLEPFRNVVEGHLQASDKVLSSPNRVAPMPGGDNQALAIRALASLPAELALPLITRQLTASRPQAKEALVALHRLFNQQAALPTLEQSTLDALAVIAESADPDLRQLSLRVLGQIDPQHPRIALALQDPDSLVILEALQLLKASGQKGPEQAQAIKPLLEHKESGVQQLALQLLAQSDDQAIEPVLAAAMEPHGEMLMAGRQAIAQLKPELTLQWLSRALELSEKPNQRLLIAELLVAVNNQAA